MPPPPFGRWTGRVAADMGSEGQREKSGDLADRGPLVPAMR